MKMNKTVAAVAAGMIAFGAFFSTSAAGIGYVDTNAALQSHPKMQKAQLDMRQAVQKAQENFEKRSQGKSDQEKQQIMTEIQKEMNQKESSTMQPIFNDVRKAKTKRFLRHIRQKKGSNSSSINHYPSFGQ